MDEITIRKPDDFHVHLRDGDMLEHVLPYTANLCARALVMPNLHPRCVLTARDAKEYRLRIAQASPSTMDVFTPLMTIQITDLTNPMIVTKAHQSGVVAGKLYPAGVTTNSDNGVTDIRSLFPAFNAMQACGMMLCLHGEHPGERIDDIDREAAFMHELAKIVANFPMLKIVLEHVSHRAGVAAVLRWDNVAATVTPHHLLLTMNDVYGARLQPHHFCKPTPKRFKDRDAILQHVLEGHPKFFLGTDSAPHLRGTKECASGCAGVFNAPVAIPLLAELLEQHEALDKLENFTSRFGAEWYGLPLNRQTLTLRKEPWTVPDNYDDIVPLWAGREISWRVIG